MRFKWKMTLKTRFYDKHAHECFFRLSFDLMTMPADDEKNKGSLQMWYAYFRL